MLPASDPDSAPSVSDPDSAPSVSEDSPALPTDTWATRQVCASVYVYDWWRQLVLDMFILDWYWAWAPSYELDLVAVTRHARAAHRRLVVRDAVLAAILIATLATATAVFLTRHDAVWLAVTAAVALLGVVAVRVGRRRWRSWAQRWRQLLRDDAGKAIAQAVAVLVLSGVGVWVVVRDGSALTYLVVLGTGLFGAWTVIAVHGFVAQSRARAVWRSTRSLASIAPAGPRWLETRLDELAEANVLTFDHQYRKDDNFVGAGQLHYDWSITTDIQEGIADADGVRAVPKPVDIIELHHWIENAIRDAGIPGMSCTYRVYVDGQGLNRDLLVDGFGPPKTAMPFDRVLSLLREPGYVTRTYLCLQHSSRNGALVVTTFIRGEVVGHQLHVQIQIFWLPPVSLLPPTVLRMTPWEHLYTTARQALRETTGLLAGSPVRLVSALAAPLRRGWNRRSQRRRIRYDEFYNYGAVRSLREILAFGERLHSNAREDLVRSFETIEPSVTKAVVEYLKDRGIDTTKLEDAAKTTINNYQNHVQRLSAKNVSFGPKSRAGDDGDDTGSKAERFKPPPKPETPPATRSEPATGAPGG